MAFAVVIPEMGYLRRIAPKRLKCTMRRNLSVTSGEPNSMEKITNETEEFLESIYRLQERNGVVKTSKLVKMLKVAPGTVTNTVERLEKRRLVTHETYRGVKLTEKGRNIALGVLRKHRLSERLLTDVLHMEWNRVHEAACRLEHGITDDVAENIENVLDEPRTCPHGNPIPTTGGGIFEEHSHSLSELSPGEKGIVTRITDEEPGILERIDMFGLRPGTHVRVIENAFPSGPITASIGQSECEISARTASVVRVRVLGGGSHARRRVEKRRAETEK